MTRAASAGKKRPSGTPVARAEPSGRPATLTALATCFFFSGAASLMLEVVWTRELRLVFGSTPLAVSTILVAYMLGLGLGGLGGSRLAGRLGDGVRAFGFAEICIGLYALLVPAAFWLMPALNREVLHSLAFW